MYSIRSNKTGVFMLTPLILLENVVLTAFAFCAFDDWKTREIDDWKIWAVYAFSILYGLMNNTLATVLVSSAMLAIYLLFIKEKEIGNADVWLTLAIANVYGTIIMLLVFLSGLGLSIVYERLARKPAPLATFLYVALSVYLAVVNFPSTFLWVYGFIH